MLSGSKNLAYIARGVRTYAEKPVLARPRGCWEFQFILEGRARPTDAETPANPAASPRLHVFPPDSPHGWTDDPGRFSRIFVAQFHEIPEELRDRLSDKVGWCVRFDNTERRRLENRLASAWDEIRATGPLASLAAQKLLIELASLVIEKTEGPGRPADPADKVAKAFRWLEENLAENPGVEDAARAVGVSAAHLRRLCAESGRPSPAGELVRLRMAAAQAWLRQGWKQAAVAEYLGYSEVSAFSRAFREACGVAPGEWLAKARPRSRR